MNVLVTGGAGYIGSILVPLLLERGHRVRVLDSLMHGGQSMLGFWSHPEFEFLKGDVRDSATRSAAIDGMEAVVHLAAIVGDPACARDPEMATAVNREASLALIQTCQDAGLHRFIFASTCSNYGRMEDPTSYVDETSNLSPVSLYAETKVSVERFLLDMQSTSLVPTVVRFATVYGVSPRMRFDLTVNEFAMELSTTGKLDVFGEQFWRPYVHVRDAARAVVTVLDAPDAKVNGEVFNVGDSAENYQKKQLVDLITPLAPGATVEYVHKTEDPRDYRVAFEKIQQQLGFHVSRTVPDGIREVIDLVRTGMFADYSEKRFRN
jgi:nucleoside-diphosphate-sugar epimerase